MNLNTYEARLSEAIGSLNVVLSTINSDNYEDELVNLDYCLAKIKTAIRMQMK